MGRRSVLVGVLAYGNPEAEARARARSLARRVMADRIENGAPIPSEWMAGTSPAMTEAAAKAGAYCVKVLQESTWPLFRPVVSHIARAADEPWVKLSGTA